jgi:NTE family protein
MSTVTITARPAAGRGPAPPPRTAFVLAGGAALGAMQAGMVRALYERGIVPGLLAAPRPGP